MGSEQVAQVLRQCGNRVKLVVTRGPVEETPPSAVMSVVLPTVTEQQVKLKYARDLIHSYQIDTFTFIFDAAHISERMLRHFYLFFCLYVFR